MMELDAVRISLPLKKKFVVSKGAAEVKINVLTMLNNRYVGEASGSVYYGPSIEAIETDIHKGIEKLKALPEITRATLDEINTYDLSPVARSALMGMVLHYLSGESQRYPWEILGLPTPVGIKSSMTISIDNPADMVRAIQDSSYPIIKVKMGSAGDPELIQGMQSITDHELRVDANGGWTCEQAEEYIFYLAKAGVKIIEQPTDIKYIEEWPHLKGKNEGVEMIVDEGLKTLKDYEQIAQFVDGVNIKMEKSGGIIESMAIAEKARQDKKKVMLGCMVESSVGIAQSVYLSSMADYCDLDGPQLLEQDIASGITYNKERIQVDREIIGGPKLRRELVEKYIR